MTLRTSVDDGFPVAVCEGRAPAVTRQLVVGSSPAPILTPEVRRIVIIGDTGCRLEGRAVQDCNDPEAWPFAEIAGRAAGRKPDLVIHVGDYYYRETACPVDRKGCAGSSHGDNWETWQADFFEPAAPLLAAAPWVLVRGNHELCRRDGHGWFRLLDPHMLRSNARIGAIRSGSASAASTFCGSTEPMPTTSRHRQKKSPSSHAARRPIGGCPPSRVAPYPSADLGSGARRDRRRKCERHRAGCHPRAGSARSRSRCVGPSPRFRQL